MPPHVSHFLLARGGGRGRCCCSSPKLCVLTWPLSTVQWPLGGSCNKLESLQPFKQVYHPNSGQRWPRYRNVMSQCRTSLIVGTQAAPPDEQNTGRYGYGRASLSALQCIPPPPPPLPSPAGVRHFGSSYDLAMRIVIFNCPSSARVLFSPQESHTT